MFRFAGSTALFAFAALAAVAAPAARAQSSFDLTADMFGGGPQTIGTISVPANLPNATYAFSSVLPSIHFTLQGLTFTEDDIFNPTEAAFVLSGAGPRRFQFTTLPSTSLFVFFDRNFPNGNTLEVSFDSAQYGTSSPEFRGAYTALSAADSITPEPGSLTALTALAVAGVGLAGRRRSRKA